VAPPVAGAAWVPPVGAPVPDAEAPPVPAVPDTDAPPEEPGAVCVVSVVVVEVLVVAGATLAEPFGTVR
jgi:hypothetical protein